MPGNSAKVRLVLQTRDWQLLRELIQLRILDREIAKIVAPFRSTTRANTRLLALVEAGYLLRVPVGTVRGGHKYLYGLTRKAAAAIKEPYRALPWNQSSVVAGQPFLEHQLRLNDLYLALKYGPLPADRTLKVWRTFRHAVDSQVRLIPDAYCEVVSGTDTKAMFVEIDQGTESLRVWRQKVDQYLALATSGVFNRLFSQAQFRVLIVVPSLRRLQTVSKCIAAKTIKIFWLTTHAHVSRIAGCTSHWYRPGSDQPIPLF